MKLCEHGCRRYRCNDCKNSKDCKRSKCIDCEKKYDKELRLSKTT